MTTREQLALVEELKLNLTFHPSGQSEVPGNWRLGWTGCIPFALGPILFDVLEYGCRALREQYSDSQNKSIDNSKKSIDTRTTV